MALTTNIKLRDCALVRIILRVPYMTCVGLASAQEMDATKVAVDSGGRSCENLCKLQSHEAVVAERKKVQCPEQKIQKRV